VFMSRHRSSNMMCANPDCMKFSLPTRDKRCKRCGLENLTKHEFDRYFEMTDVIDGDRPPVISSKPTASKPQADFFSCPAVLTGCPIATPPTIYVPQSMFDLWIYLARSSSTEWIAYVTGVQDGSEFILEETYFPTQRANSVHVSVTGEREVLPGTIAAVHSHVDMSVFFSEEDQRHMNHTIEMIVNRKGEILASVQTVLKCGELHRGAGKVVLTGTAEQEHALKDLNSKLTKESLVEVSKPNGHSGGYGELVKFNHIKS